MKEVCFETNKTIKWRTYKICLSSYFLKIKIRHKSDLISNRTWFLWKPNLAKSQNQLTQVSKSIINKTKFNLNLQFETVFIVSRCIGNICYQGWQNCFLHFEHLGVIWCSNCVLAPIVFITNQIWNVERKKNPWFLNLLQ